MSDKEVKMMKTKTNNTNLKIIALSALLSLQVLTFALPMTPYQNGASWVASACESDPTDFGSIIVVDNPPILPDYEKCCAIKCSNLYPGSNNAGAWLDCTNGCDAAVSNWYDNRNDA